jgi:thiol-disulfide isomerase/thioredoxin
LIENKCDKLNSVFNLIFLTAYNNNSIIIMSDGITKHLKKQNFKANKNDVFIKDYQYQKPGMMLIWATWCGHCVRFKPTYKELSEFLNKNQTTFPMLAIESEDIDEDLASKLNFRGFRTIKYIDRDGKLIKDYNGGRDIDSMLKDICTTYHQCYKR